MPYLVDSDVMVDLTRGSSGAADYLDGLADAWSISAITCLELLAGARTKRGGGFDSRFEEPQALPDDQRAQSRSAQLLTPPSDAAFPPPPANEILP